MLENGADIRFIQEMLGHAKLDTTQEYTRVSIIKLKQTHSATHPSARLKKHSENKLGEEEKPDVLPVLNPSEVVHFKKDVNEVKHR